MACLSGNAGGKIYGIVTPVCPFLKDDNPGFPKCPISELLVLWQLSVVSAVRFSAIRVGFSIYQVRQFSPSVFFLSFLISFLVPRFRRCSLGLISRLGAPFVRKTLLAENRFARIYSALSMLAYACDGAALREAANQRCSRNTDPRTTKVTAMMAVLASAEISSAFVKSGTSAIDV